MKVIHYRDVDPEVVEAKGAGKTTIRWLIAAGDGAPNFAMRLFEVEPGGQTPLHTHDWEHEVFILSGEGSVWKEGEEISVSPGTAVFVSPQEKHRFRNAGAEKLRLICLVPV